MPEDATPTVPVAADPARAAADRAVFMDGGKIVEEDTPDVLFSNPSQERTKLFLSKIL